MPLWSWRRDRPRIEVRVTDGPPLPPETRIREDLRDVRFEPQTPSVVFDSVTVERVDFSGLRLKGLYFGGCRVLDCDLSRLDVDWLPIAGGGTLFGDCRFHGAKLGNFAAVARFERCDFSNADLAGWFTWDEDVVDCRFAGRLERVVFTAKPPHGRRRNEIRGNDFRDAELHDVGFRGGIDLDAQLLPTGHAYVMLRDAIRRMRHARGEIRRWPDDREQTAALAMLDLAISIFEVDDNGDVFTRRDFVLDLCDDAAVADRVLDLLESGVYR
jgi:uncharacterized protein YjbI with pentapeptide repeats